MKRSTILALAAAMTLAACTSTEKRLDKESIVEGKPASIALTFDIEGGATRVGKPATPAQEAKIGSVAIWIFDSSGNPVEVPTGGFEVLTLDNANTSNRIETLSGNGRRIYVGVNIPDAAPVANEAALLDRKETIADISVEDNHPTYTVNDFAMMSEVQIVNIPAQEEKQIAVEVHRVAAKLVVTATEPLYKPNDTANGGKPWGTDGVTIQYEVCDWDVYHDAMDSYLIKRATGTGNLKSHAAVNAHGNQGLVPLGPDHSPSWNIPTRYIGENFNHDGRHANTTYVMISMKVKVSKTAVWDVVSGKVVWSGRANEADGASDAIDDDDDLYVFFDEDNDRVYIALRANAQEIANNTGIQACIYPSSYVHFMVYLYEDGVNDYNVNRNDFINLIIEGVQNVDGKGNPTFPGYPGLARPDAWLPIDPTDNTPGLNPHPVDPDKPIDGAPTGIKASVSVLGWKRETNSVLLED